jgi:hypothetical protein
VTKEALGQLYFCFNKETESSISKAPKVTLVSTRKIQTGPKVKSRSKVSLENSWGGGKDGEKWISLSWS